MNLSAIISISGKPGLSKIVSQSRKGIIVESLINGSRTHIHGAERVSSLEDISIYTYEEDVLLSEVFQKMKEFYKGKEALSHKSSAKELNEVFKQILPNYDEGQVYNSDIKKVFQWYNLLLEKGLLEESKEEKEDPKKEETTAQKTEKKTQEEEE